MSIIRLIAGREQDIISCSPDETVREATARLAEHRIGAMPVMDGNRVVGIFSERDLLYCVARKAERAFDLTIGEVMTAPPITAPSDPAAIRVARLRRWVCAAYTAAAMSSSPAGIGSPALATRTAAKVARYPKWATRLER